MRQMMQCSVDPFHSSATLSESAGLQIPPIGVMVLAGVSSVFGFGQFHHDHLPPDSPNLRDSMMIIHIGCSCSGQVLTVTHPSLSFPSSHIFATI